MVAPPSPIGHFRHFWKMVTPQLDQFQIFLKSRTFWLRFTPLDRHLKWHICIRKGYITLKKVKMKVEPLGQSQSEFILFILDGVGGLLLIQTFLKNRFSNWNWNISSFFHLPRPPHLGHCPKILHEVGLERQIFSIMFPLLWFGMSMWCVFRPEVNHN